MRRRATEQALREREGVSSSRADPRVGGPAALLVHSGGAPEAAPLLRSRRLIDAGFAKTSAEFLLGRKFLCYSRGLR